MKKSLLFAAAAALIGSSVASAQTYKDGAYYMEGEAITSVDGLTSGLYFIKVHARDNDKPTFDRGEVLLRSNKDRGGYFYNEFNIPEMGTTNGYLLWDITVTEGTEEATGLTGKMFTVKSVDLNKYWSKEGSTMGPSSTVNNVVYPARGDMMTTTDETKIGKYMLEELPATYVAEGGGYPEGLNPNGHRFFVKLANGKFGNSNGRVDIAYVHNNTGTPIRLGYWADAATNKTTIQFEFIKAVENTNITTITVNFPQFNMDNNVSLEIPMSPGMGVNDIKAQVDNFIANLGGMNITKYPDFSATSADNTYTVEGSWVNQLIPNHVYRFNIRPDDSAANTAAVRYVRDDAEQNVQPGDIGYILTRNGGAASFNTIELERFWYFKEVQAPTETEGGVYTIHNLARPYDKGVYVADANNELCSLFESQTEFRMVASDNTQIKSPGDFAFRINAVDNNYLNDVDGKLGVWKNGEDARNDGGSLIRLTALVDDDFSDFAQFAPAELVAAAKAEPTAENVLALYEYYTGRDLEAAIYAAETYTIGDEVGQYNNADGNFAELLAAAKEVAANASATDEEKVAAAASISEYSLVVNMPVPGRFYRFKNRTSGELLSSLPITKDGSLKTMPHAVPTDGIDVAGANTVFYLHEEDGNLLLVAFADGKVISKFAKVNGSPWSFVLKGSDHASTGIKFGHRGKNGGFVVCVDPENHRHIYHDTTDKLSDNIGCGSGANNGYQWDVIPVTSLPVPLVDLPNDADDASTPAFYFSVHSPVALENIDNVEAYTGEFNGKEVVKTKITGTIPANTPVLMEYKGGVHHGDHGDYLFFPIADAVSTQADAVSTDINGGIFAFEKEENTHYYTLHETTSNRFRRHGVYADAHEEVENNVVPGFKAHIAVPASENPTEYFEIVDNPSTGIDAVEVENAEKAAKVYDLQGRKLAAPAKGINIINGQKVLVK